MTATLTAANDELEVLGREATENWIYDAAMQDVGPGTSDEEIIDLVEGYQEYAQTEGRVIDEDTAHIFMTILRAKLRRALA